MATQITAYEDLTVSTSAVTFTATTVANANYAVLVVEDAPVRYRLDGGTPTTSVGVKLNIGDQLELTDRSEVINAKFISEDGASAKLRVHYGTVVK